VLLAGGAIRCVTLRKPDFTFDFEELEQSVSDKTKAIIINNPHNPTGKVYTKEELDFIAKLAIKHDLLVFQTNLEFLTIWTNISIATSTHKTALYNIILKNLYLTS
jgi:bifunctional pyridoxal-dependent enzyme with beta-cystathionase and maltose regulon repressor activities